MLANDTVRTTCALHGGHVLRKRKWIPMSGERGLRAELHVHQRQVQLTRSSRPFETTANAAWADSPHCSLFTRSPTVLRDEALLGESHSLVVRKLWVLEVAGSNPASPTN